MTLKLTVVSPEIEDFVMVLMIDANATFLDLHRLILRACNYQEGDKHRFYVCDDEWHPEQRILLFDDGSTPSDEDLYLMEDTMLGDYLEDEGQRLAYRFDPESKRLFLIELSETIFGQRQDEPVIKRRHGVPPMQTVNEDEPLVAPAPTAQDPELDESFYGDEGFEAEEFDEEGFDILE